MKRLLFIVLLVVFGYVFAEDELNDRRVFSFNIIASPRNISSEDSDIYKWANESDGIISDNVWGADGIVSFSLFYTKPNSIGGYLNYGQQKTFDESNSTLTAQEAKEKYNYYSQPGYGGGFSDFPRIKEFHFEGGITYQPINNLATYTGLTLKLVDYLNYLAGDDRYINSKKYIGMSFGILLIPYQTKQYSGLTLQLGYSNSFGFGGGIDLGIGYRI